MTLKRTGMQRGTSQLKRTGPIKSTRISVIPGQSWANPTRPSNHLGRPPKPVDEAAITALYEAGRSLQGLAREFHINSARVKEIVEANGGKIRNPGRPKGSTKSWTAEERRARDRVHGRSGGSCEICDASRSTNYQHRLAEGQGGPTTVANGLDVCGMGNATGCHSVIHLNPDLAVENGWTVKSRGNPETTPVLRRGEWVLLDNNGGYQVLADFDPVRQTPVDEANHVLRQA